ncbi:MAG: helix-turn-helix domain-containing protein [Anaerolineae bacterium]
MIAQALERAGGNQSEAARLLGVTRDVLRYSLSKYDLK